MLSGVGSNNAKSILHSSFGISAMQTEMSRLMGGLAWRSTMTHGTQYATIGNKHDPDTTGLDTASTGS